MSKLKSRANGSKSQATLLLFVTLLTGMVVIFSTYMSASFWSGLGATTSAFITFLLLGVFLELSKICAGIAAILAHSTKNMRLKIIALVVLTVLTLVSFTASIGTISEQISSGKNIAYNSNTDVKMINAAIIRQDQIIASLMLSQKHDIDLGYRARSNDTLLQIKLEQDNLNKLHGRLHDTKASDFSVSNVISIFNMLVPIGQDQWEHLIVLISGALTEMTGLFLLYLNFNLRSSANSDYKTDLDVQPALKDSGKRVGRYKLPISHDEYNKLTDKVRRGDIAPTQRDLKKTVKLGNEKIAKIVAQWLEDGVITKNGRSYSVAA